MTDLQLYILVAIPLVGIVVSTGMFMHLSARIEVLTGKVIDIDNRLMRLEDRSAIC
jgi:hypothetical protein